MSKGDKKYEPVNLTWWIVGLVMMALLVALETRADDGHGHDHHDGGDVDVTTGDLIGGDTTLSGGDTNVSTGGNKTFAFSHSLGDVDINEGKNCLGSEAWGTIIVSHQYLELNPWCASLFYELNGMHEFAAKMRCDIKEIGNKYTTLEDCWRDQNLTPAEPSGEGSSGIADAIVSHHDEDLQSVQMQIAEVTERLDHYEEVVSSPPPQIVQQAAPEQYTDEDRDYILGLYSKGEVEDE